MSSAGRDGVYGLLAVSLLVTGARRAGIRLDRRVTIIRVIPNRRPAL